MSKSRLAPWKKMQFTPRLELQADLLGVWLAKYIENELKLNINRRYFWTESSTVLILINSAPRKISVYVKNRLMEIRKLSKRDKCKWVPSDGNPADDATRPKNKAKNGSRWFKGPDFLKLPMNEWPSQNFVSDKEKGNINNLELRKTHTCMILQLKDPFKIRLLGWSGILVIDRRIRKYFNRWQGNSKIYTGVEAIKDAETFCYRTIQSESFEKEIKSIKENLKFPKDSEIAHVNQYLDNEGILRANGRATKLPTKEFNNYPMILHAKHEFLGPLIAKYHNRYYHGSLDTVLNELRQSFYIIGLRSALRSLMSKYLVCKMNRAKPQNPKMAPLSTGRLAVCEKPFTHCGLDYFGPMNVKIGRRREKRWGVIFTCVSIRAIHLELTNSLTSSLAIMALQRLAARRGTLKIVLREQAPSEEVLITLMTEIEYSINSRPLTHVSLDPRN